MYMIHDMKLHWNMEPYCLVIPGLIRANPTKGEPLGGSIEGLIYQYIITPTLNLPYSNTNGTPNSFKGTPCRFQGALVVWRGL